MFVVALRGQGFAERLQGERELKTPAFFSGFSSQANSRATTTTNATLINVVGDTVRRPPILYGKTIFHNERHPPLYHDSC